MAAICGGDMTGGALPELFKNDLIEVFMPALIPNPYSSP